MRSLFIQATALIGLLLAGQAVHAGQPTIYFGVYEVEGGKLKSADGSLPVAGETATLAVDLDGLSALACHNQQYQACLQPTLYVRFNGNESFTEVGNLPQGSINSRGPSVVLNGYQSFPVALSVPTNADRIETYISFDRFAYSAANCHMAYDMTECDIYGQSFQERLYLSNYGRNFQIPVSGR